MLGLRLGRRIPRLQPLCRKDEPEANRKRLRGSLRLPDARAAAGPLQSRRHRQEHRLRTRPVLGCAAQSRLPHSDLRLHQLAGSRPKHGRKSPGKAGAAKV